MMQIYVDNVTASIRLPETLEQVREECDLYRISYKNFH